MIVTFDPAGRAVVVPVIVAGPTRPFRFHFALDTGASHTSMRATFLEYLGFNPAAATKRKRFRSATGTAVVPVLDVSRIIALGQTRLAFPVAAHDPPPGVTADGLLGLDFFRGRVLTLDFARGRASLSPPRRWWQFWR
jgi:hypothetical protein